ncbi:hypothetical protein LWM68_11595 [Niabella sp. W65]|nr:hypothetical protein [Niabella sp. W65]MCH7363338.1 hypothetical protein [Niabella sp. W65]ULT39263.1 hypothetical protein KRR40_30350 [Niabella sp. I65]
MRKLLMMALVGLSFLACSKKDKIGDTDEPRIDPIPGLGNVAGDIRGTAFVLPEGVVLEGAITGESLNPVCKEVGTGRFVDVYLVLKNTASAAIKVTLPAGLTLKSVSGEDQNGILADGYDISITQGTACIVKLNAYCANASKHPSSYTSRYTFGPICNAPAITYLLKLLKNKDLSKDEDHSAQGIIWMITDNATDPEDSGTVWKLLKERIALLPNK